jgi:hypothetical protein
VASAGEPDLPSRCPPDLARLRTKAAANSSAGRIRSERRAPRDLASGSPRSLSITRRPSASKSPHALLGLSRFGTNKQGALPKRGAISLRWST